MIAAWLEELNPVEVGGVFVLTAYAAFLLSMGVVWLVDEWRARK